MHNAEAMKPLAAPLSVLKILLVLMGAFIRIPLAYARPLKDTRIHILDDVPPADDPGFWAYLGVASALVLLGGAFSGLTIAYVHIFLNLSGMFSVLTISLVSWDKTKSTSKSSQHPVKEAKEPTRRKY